MRKLLVIWMLLAASAAVMGQELTETRQAAARAAIDAVLSERFIAGWNAHNAHLFASAFAADADFTNVRGIGVSGRDNIEKFHADVFARFFMHSHQSAQVQKIRFLNADIAVVDVRWQMSGALDPNGKTMPDRSGLLDLVFTFVNGEWLISVMHNTDLTAAPVPAPSPAPAPAPAHP